MTEAKTEEKLAVKLTEILKTVQRPIKRWSQAVERRMETAALMREAREIDKGIEIRISPRT